MEEPKNKIEQEEKNPIIVFITNLFAAIKLPPFPQKKKNEEPTASSTKIKPAADVGDDNNNNNDKGVSVVSFPKQSFVPLKLEAEAEEAERSTNPVILWQVYAIGGFFILRWAWSRWNERKGPKKSDDEPPPASSD